MELGICPCHSPLPASCQNAVPKPSSHNFFLYQFPYSICLPSKQVSFVGRPFPLSDAHEHFSRLQHWGYTLLRFIITWEAVEHAGPGIYDEEYLDYLYQVVDKARDYGFWVWIDPHQDVWSRFTAGSGAPGWTLEVVGFDLRKLEATGAAIVHQLRGDPYTHMLWPTNYTKLACATMFMLFYAGKVLCGLCVCVVDVVLHTPNHSCAPSQIPGSLRSVGGGDPEAGPGLRRNSSAVDTA